MYENVMVFKVISSKRAMVMCSTSACSGCKSEAFCNNKGRTFEVSNTKELPLQEGTNVRIFLKPSRTILSSFLLLFFPLIFFPVLFILSRQLGGSEVASLLWGIGGICLGFLLVGFYFKISKNKYLPSVEEIVD
ncbi:MAG: SoxR reducing system RseC family protein [Sphaerochaetaceae bacterium]|jgi:sigma-E factor negative regulatory protein RseC